MNGIFTIGASSYRRPENHIYNEPNHLETFISFATTDAVKAVSNLYSPLKDNSQNLDLSDEYQVQENCFKQGLF